jgi:hypothetical protein
MRFSPRLFVRAVVSSVRNLWPSRRFPGTVARRNRRVLQQARGGRQVLESLEPRLALAHTSLASLTIPAPVASNDSVIASAGLDPAVFISHVAGLDATLGSVFGGGGPAHAPVDNSTLNCRRASLPSASKSRCSTRR